MQHYVSYMIIPRIFGPGLFCTALIVTIMLCCAILLVTVRDGHGGGWSRKINAWHLYTLMVYL
jgi:hypothetical protein